MPQVFKLPHTPMSDVYNLYIIYNVAIFRAFGYTSVPVHNLAGALALAARILLAALALLNADTLPTMTFSSA